MATVLHSLLRIGTVLHSLLSRGTVLNSVMLLSCTHSSVRVLSCTHSSVMLLSCTHSSVLPLSRTHSPVYCYCPALTRQYGYCPVLLRDATVLYAPLHCDGLRASECSGVFGWLPAGVSVDTATRGWRPVFVNTVLAISRGKTPPTISLVSSHVPLVARQLQH